MLASGVQGGLLTGTIGHAAWSRQRGGTCLREEENMHSYVCMHAHVHTLVTSMPGEVETLNFGKAVRTTKSPSIVGEGIPDVPTPDAQS